ncbi:MAG: OmpH family outer membrane protein [Bacteroidota bacterium]
MKKVLWTINTLAIVIGLGALFLLWKNTPKTAFVDLGYLYENFNGKKELANRLLYFENQQKGIMDSLAMDITSLQKKVTPQTGKAVLAKLNQQQSNYYQLQRNFADQYQQQDQQYAEEVWQQINQYVIEYGEANGYDYIYGTSGNGSLMYGCDQRNISPQVLNYINQRYEGI